jgi:hypothetical protein
MNLIDFIKASIVVKIQESLGYIALHVRPTSSLHKIRRSHQGGYQLCPLDKRSPTLIAAFDTFKKYCATGHTSYKDPLSIGR